MLFNFIRITADNLNGLIDFLGFTENDKLDRFVYENDIAKLTFYMSAPTLLDVTLKRKEGDIDAEYCDYIVEDENGRYYVYDSIAFENLKNKYKLIK